MWDYEIYLKKCIYESQCDEWINDAEIHNQPTIVISWPYVTQLDTSGGRLMRRAPVPYNNNNNKNKYM